MSKIVCNKCNVEFDTLWDCCIIPDMCDNCYKEQNDLKNAQGLLKHLDACNEGFATVLCKRDYTCKVVQYCMSRDYIECCGLNYVLTHKGKSVII